VAGLRTVAVFDAKTDEFIIHSPDLTVIRKKKGVFKCLTSPLLDRLQNGGLVDWE
jgi:hypothetical protein